MTRDELMSHCKYYKGEDENPFDDRSEYPKDLFWQLEKDFVNLSLADAEFLQGWENYAQSSYIQNVFEGTSFVAQDATQQAIIAYIFTMIEKWSPYAKNEIFKY